MSNIDSWQATAAGLAQDLSNAEETIEDLRAYAEQDACRIQNLLDEKSSVEELLEQWRSFALSMWGEMELCNEEEKCIKKKKDSKCPCDYYKQLVLNK